MALYGGHKFHTFMAFAVTMLAHPKRWFCWHPLLTCNVCFSVNIDYHHVQSVKHAKYKQPNEQKTVLEYFYPNRSMDACTLCYKWNQLCEGGTETIQSVAAHGQTLLAGSPVKVTGVSWYPPLPMCSYRIRGTSRAHELQSYCTHCCSDRHVCYFHFHCYCFRKC